MAGTRQEATVPAPECGRAFAQIDDGIENGSAGNPDQLALGFSVDLVVHPSEHVFIRTAVVILDKIDIEADFGEDLSVPCFEEKPSFVAVQRRLEEQSPFNF